MLLEAGDRTSRFTLLFKLLKNILDANDAAVLDILQDVLGDNRFDEVGGLLECLEMTDITDCLDASDRQIAGQLTEQLSQGKIAKEQFQKEYVAARNRVTEAAAAAEAAPKKKGKAKAKAAAAAEAAPPPPPPPGDLPPGVLEQGDIRRYCPPKGYIWRGNVAGSWSCHFQEGKFQRGSFAWDMYGHRFSAVLCIRKLWSEYLLVKGLGRDACPFPRLWDITADECAEADAKGAHLDL